MDENLSPVAEAAAQHQQAIEDARAEQIGTIVDLSIKRFFDTRSSSRFIDVNRIPFICDDLKGLHTSFNDLTSDLRWIKYIGGGFVVAAGLLALKSLGV